MESLEVLHTANINIRGARCNLTTGKFHGASGTSHDFLCFSSPINLTHAEVAHQTKHLWESSTIVVIDMPSHIKLEDSAPSDDINPYVILGIEKSATEAEIRTAYKKLALVQHPGKLSFTSLRSRLYLTSTRLSIPMSVLTRLLYRQG